MAKVCPCIRSLVQTLVLPQDVVDSLEVEVRAKGELQGKLDKAAAEATSLRSRVSTLEQELAKSGSSQQAMQVRRLWVGAGGRGGKTERAGL